MIARTIKPTAAFFLLVLLLAACAPAATPAAQAPAAPAAATAAAPTAVPTATTATQSAQPPAATATQAPAAAATTAPKPTEPPAPTATQAPTAKPAATATQAPAANVSFAKDVMPIFEKSCIKCHGGEKTEALLSLKDYAGVMAGSENGPVVVPGKAGDSSLVTLVQQGKMPKRANRLPDAQIKILADWVNAGAPNN